METKLDYNQKLYYKTIICDFDDTISLTNTKDWENSTPNIKLIEKLNYLYDLGWQIIILTARGQLSCEGDFALADRKYRKQIEFWLSKNGVKYSKLSFKKYLGLYYVDDKNLSIGEFCNLNVDVFDSGKSGANIQLVGDKVFKTSESVDKEICWYYLVLGKLNTPKIHSFVGNTVCLEFLKSERDFNLNDIFENINIISKLPTSNQNNFTTYIKRIQTHCELLNSFFEIIPVLEQLTIHFDKHISFCHGDFSVENVIFNNRGCFLIDPIFNETFYSSYLLDISKFLFSLKKNNMFDEYAIFEKKYSDILYLIKPLEITQAIRTIKYLSDLDERNKIIDLTVGLIDEYFKKNK